MSATANATEAAAPNRPSVPEEHRARLERDFACYRRELSRLLAEGHGGRYALIHDGQVLSVWDTQRDAMQAGCERFGLEPFAVNRVNPADVERFAQLDAGRGSACPS